MLLLILTGFLFSLTGVYLILLMSYNKISVTTNDEKETKNKQVNKYKKLTIIFSVASIFFMFATTAGIGSTYNYEPKITVTEYSLVDYSEDEIFGFDRVTGKLICKYEENGIVESLHIPHGETSIQHKENSAKIIKKSSDFPLWVSLVGINCDSTLYEIYI